MLGEHQNKSYIPTRVEHAEAEGGCFTMGQKENIAHMLTVQARSASNVEDMTVAVPTTRGPTKGFQDSKHTYYHTPTASVWHNESTEVTLGIVAISREAAV